MSQSLRIATWNVKRPKIKGWLNNPVIINKISIFILINSSA